MNDLRQLETRLGELDKQIEAIARSNPVTQRLQQLRGVGPLVATALIAAVGDGSHFSKGRQMAAAMGLTPRQYSSGDKRRLLGISKRGDAYLRTLLIHGARAVVSQARRRDDRLSQWVTDIAQHRHTNVTAVAPGQQNGAHRLGDVARAIGLRPHTGGDLNRTTNTPPTTNA